MENREIWVGLDVSTNCIGVCVFVVNGSERGEILKLTSISPKVEKGVEGIKALFDKKRLFKEFIVNEMNDTHIDKVIIEEPLLRSNNVNTVSTLLRFNGMIADCIYETFNVVPEFISSYDARYYSFPELISIRKTDKKGVTYPEKTIQKAINDNHLVLFGAYPFDIDKKQVMMDKVNEVYGDITWQMNKKGEFKKQNYDACDALVAVLGYRNKLKYETETPGIVDCKKLEQNGVNKGFKYTVRFGDKLFTKEIHL